MSRRFIVAAALLAFLPLSGCLGGGSGSFDFVPGTKYKETGYTIHLNARVLDFDLKPYDGLTTYMWAFCFAPTDPGDERSANAIEGWTLREGEGARDAGGNPLELRPGEKCGVPGPTLRVKQGDKVIVEFAHSHFHPHTIHWHGQFVDYLSDGAPGSSQEAVASGGAYRYEFVAKRAGTLWYHCHVDTQFHVMQGLYGMMIIEPQDKTYEPKGIDAEYNLVFSTLNRNSVEAFGSRHAHPPGCASGFVDCKNPRASAGEPDVFMINGHSYPYTMDQPETLITVKEGDKVRLRLLNAGETVEQVHLHGHDMLVIAKDGNPLSKQARYWADTISIGPAERYDVVVTADNPGPWMIHTHVSSHETNCAKAPGGMHTMFVYEDYLEKMHEFRAELPADCQKGDVLELPSDFANSTTFTVDSVNPFAGTSQVPAEITDNFPADLRSWTVPVELLCGVRKFAIHAQAGATDANGGLVTVRIVRPDGTTPDNGTFTLDPDSPSDGFVAEHYTLAEVQEGNTTIEVRGFGTDVPVSLQAYVDYYETFEQSRIGHLTYKVGGCTGYT